MFFVTGKIVSKSLVKSGVSEKGAWKMITFLIEKTKHKKKIKIPFVAKGKLAEKVSEIVLGQRITIQFYIFGREHGGNYYPNVVATDVEKYVKKPKYTGHYDNEKVWNSPNTFLQTESQLFTSDNAK